MKRLYIAMTLLYLSGCSSMAVQEQGMSEVFMQAEGAYAQKQYTQAKQQYLQVIEKHPYNVEALFKLANISMREKTWDQAEQYYTRVLRSKPRHARAHHNLAMLHLMQASDHLNYYIAHNESMSNETIGELINAIDKYSKQKTVKKTSLDRVADIVNR